MEKESDTEVASGLHHSSAKIGNEIFSKKTVSLYLDSFFDFGKLDVSARSILPKSKTNLDKEKPSS